MSNIEENNYQSFAEDLKEQGNAAFKAKDYDAAVNFYTQAIAIDPDNHVLYSNRSASYLYLDYKSKALYDAEKCVSLAPVWSKGYSRLGAAQQSLKRYENAIASFKKGIALDPNNQTLWSSLRSVEEAYSNENNVKLSSAAEEEENLRKQKEAEEIINTQPKVNEEDLLSSFFTEVSEVPIAVDVKKAAVTAPVVEENQTDELDSFFAEVSNTKAAKTQAKPDPTITERDETSLTERYVNQDLGTGAEQVERLTCPNFKWKNLNPYYVLQLDIDATEEDIRYRYKKLSSKVHPDKMLGVDKARDAFEEVKIAYLKLNDADQKKVIITNIDFVRNECLKERRKLINKGAKESDLPPEAEEIDKKVMKHFADMEMSRIRTERNLHTYNARDKIAEEKEKEKIEIERDYEKDWSEANRQEKRVGNWREFQVEPEAKKSKISSYKEENRQQTKKVVVVKEEWKKNWK